MLNLFDLSLGELHAALKRFEVPTFRVKQIYRWLHVRLVSDFDLMTDLSLELRTKLKTTFSLTLPEQLKMVRSKDGTRKFLFRLADGNKIESVLITDGANRKTICISTQVGCPLKCQFCATGQLGFKRDLAPSEIIGQLYVVARKTPDISNIVFMGMGEPLLNFNNVMKAIELLIAKEGQNIGQRKITLSTAGIPEGIRRLANAKLQVRLAISLNAADDTTRNRLMPVNRRYPLAELLEAVKYYVKTTGRRITFEYILLRGINDRRSDLERLKNICQGLPVHVNLITFNPAGSKYLPALPSTANFFVKALCSDEISAVERQSKGQEILAACGQLACQE